MDIKSQKEQIKFQGNNSTEIASTSNKSAVERSDENVENICDENLITLQKIHAILLNCSNLSKIQKLEFCESERYFMKLYLKELKKK